jgi:hypothetical protein
MWNILEAQLSREELELVNSLDKPSKIQSFLDEQVEYPATNRNRCPVNVLRDRQGHCLDGALFAAAGLRRLGYPARILDMFPEPGTDDDHVLAIYQQNGCYGALAKSNFVTLRWREPVYRSLRELVMSYFDGFFNVDGVRTLRYYTPTLALDAFDVHGWMWLDSGVDEIERRLLRMRRIPLITLEMAANLTDVDRLLYKAGTLATNPAGLYKPA